jgi:hypothetical protein
MKAICVVCLVLWAAPASAQWLNQKTPGLPRTADGKPNLSAPAPRTADGKPDFTGVWVSAGGQETLGGLSTLRVEAADMKPWAVELQRERAHDFFKSRPDFMCRPSGPEAEFFEGSKRILQTPAMIAVLNANLTYRQIHLDGRRLEQDPFPIWQGYSVGHWEGRTLVVESNGFNDRTWLNNVGLPHTEKLRMTERYERPDFGHLKVDVTFVDPDAYNKPLHFAFGMQLVTDTEMLEEVCEAKQEFWTGTVSDLRKSAVQVPENVLKRYVGYYEGYWRANLRKVTVTLEDGVLRATPLLLSGSVEMIPESDSIFTTTEGVSYKFVMDDKGTVIRAEEIHRGGNYILNRKN